MKFSVYLQGLIFKTCILDDEALAIASLAVDIERHCPELQVVQTFQSPRLAMAFLKANKIDLLFLDIEMAEMNGLEFLEEFGPFKFDVIFTTAYQEFALQAIKLRAKDYLLKPVDSIELKLAVAGLVQDYQSQQVHLKPKPTKIALPDASGIEFIPLNSILYCCADKNYTTFFLNNGIQKVVSKNLGEFEKVLDADIFIRIHQSTIINVHFVQKLTKGEHSSVIMENGEELSISRARRLELLETLQRFL